MPIVYVHVVLQGGPMPGPMRVPTIDGTPPATIDAGHAGEMMQYVRGTDETDHLGRPVYRPDPLLHFRWENPPGVTESTPEDAP